MPNYLVDNFVSTKAGDPYRLIPFGEITRGGKTRMITKEYASKFKLPPFKPPVKLGSHEDETPAGGHIVGLEVREDGLYALPEFTDKGRQAVDEGHYRYHSPEILWEEGAMETNDGTIEGPVILGDALLHTPYLGESTAFYSTSQFTKEIDMTVENVSIPKTLFEQLMGYFKPEGKQEEPKNDQPVEETQEFKAVITERDDYKTKFEALQKDNEVKTLKSGIVSQLQAKDKDGRQDYGMVYVELSKANEAADMLATMTEPQRNWVMQNFKALAAQIDESKLTNELGSEKGEKIGDKPKEDFNALVLKIQGEKKIDYTAALTIALNEHIEQAKAAGYVK